MLKISEHIEFYKRNNHWAFFEKVEGWKSYFDKNISEDKISVVSNDKENYVSISLQKIKIEKDEYMNVSYDCVLSSSYYVGLDRFPNLGLNVYIEPKLNTQDTKLDYVKILLEALQEPKNFDHLDGLLTTKFNEEWIEIENTLQPLLTPFIIAQFLSLVKNLVKKGLKKSYYTKTENLNNRIRGKILVGQQIKQNILKNRLTQTVCQYQEFGFDTEANQFLKYVLSKISSHLENFYKDQEIYKNLFEVLNYCKGGFYQVSDNRFRSLKFYENNPFYKNYNLAIQIGNQILALTDYNISKKNNEEKTLHPPFWIDMSKLFELFVFKKLREHFPKDGEVSYHPKHNKQELDFIINVKDGLQAVVDAKYKPRYKKGNPSMEDARQLAGYTRLNSVYSKLGIADDTTIPAYFIYPAELSSNEIGENSDDNFDSEIFSDNKKLLVNESLRESSTYKKMYLQEVKLQID